MDYVKVTALKTGIKTWENFSSFLFPMSFSLLSNRLCDTMKPPHNVSKQSCYNACIIYYITQAWMGSDDASESLPIIHI